MEAGGWFRVCSSMLGWLVVDPVLENGSDSEWVLRILTLIVRGVFLNLKRLLFVKLSPCARSMFPLCHFNSFLLPYCFFNLCFVRCVFSDTRIRAVYAGYEHIRGKSGVC